ncbi:MAG TPA: DUF4340 domain-containing protein [Clostridia bacterium]|nr:DUF4340 domain-containing protein [Clostridia bacterium]
MNINKSATSASESTPEYSMVSPGNYDTDPDQISTLVNQLASVTASEAVSLDMSDANLSKYGLKNPANTFSCTFNGKVYTLLFGNTETDSGTENIYVMLQGRNIIYKIATSSLSFYNWNASNLVSRLLFLDNIDTVKTLTVTIDSKSYQFNLSGTDDKLKVIYNSKTLNTSYFRNYYEDVLSNQVEDMATKPANGKVVCTVKVDYRSSSKASTTMQFTQIDDRRLFWQINGKGNFYILRTTVDKLISDTKLIAANKAVATS